MEQPYIIALGRQFGSGGRVIGKMLAERLGISFYDKELLAQAAQSSGMSTEFFRYSDERQPRFLGGAFPYNFGIVAGFLGTSAVNDDTAYTAMSDFIRGLAKTQSCVIVGRTADYVLRDNPRMISVFVHASIEARVAAILRRGDAKTEQQARQLAERHNKLRANYYNFYTDKRWGDAATYHLCVDASSLPFDQIVDLIAAYVKARLAQIQ